MASTYENSLRLELIATGEAASTWGDKTNANLTAIAAAFGYATQDGFAADANATTTVADGAADPARALYFKITSSATLTATRTLTIAPNTISRVMWIENATTGSQSIAISQGSGANVTIPAGKTAVVYLDGAGAGASVVDAMASLNIDGPISAGAATFSGNVGLPLGGIIDFSGRGNITHDASTFDIAFNTNNLANAFVVKGTGAATFSGDVDVSGANPANILLSQLSVKSTTALANGNASGISFWAQTSSGLGAYASIQTVTTGDYAGKLVFTTRNGAGVFDPRMTLDASGNLLVGTTSSSGSRVYAVCNNGGATVGDFRNASATGSGMYIAGGDTASQYALQVADYANNPLMKVDGSGNLTLNTANSTLNVGNGGFSQTNYGLLGLNGSNGGFIKMGTAGVEQGAVYANSGGLTFQTPATYAMTWYPAGALAMKLDTSGNLGIGLSNPSDYYPSNLVVNGGFEGGITIVGASNNTNYLSFADSASGTARYAGMIEYNHAADEMSFRTGSVQRMKLDASGNLLVGTASNANFSRIKLAWTSGNYGIESKASADTLSYHAVFGNATYNAAGFITTTNNTAAYSTTSDPRLKSEFVAPLNALDKIVEARDNQLIGEFEFLSQPEEKVWGYNAHKLIDMQSGFGGVEGQGPRDLAIGEEYEPAVLDEDGNVITPAKTVSPAGVDQSKRVPLLEAAIYELLQMNQAQQDAIEALTARIEALEGA